ncbi:MAG: 2-phosphosulfolactate phosphatase [Niastella sp.]|nr:2-phosphosulfolactate phosphatase [Niastella sp.]
MAKPQLHVSLSPALLHLEEVNSSIVVIIDVLRATSTIATALYNGAKAIVPVDSVAECIRIGKQIEAITAGERDGRIAEGLQYGNSPFDYPPDFIKDKVLVLTTTNGTKLLHMALEKSARGIITGSFPNLDAVCTYLKNAGENIILGCAAWKDRINIEDSLFAGAVIENVKDHFEIKGDAASIAHGLYIKAKDDLFGFMKINNASHYHRLMGFGLEKDIRYCLTPNGANILPIFNDGKLVKG